MYIIYNDIYFIFKYLLILLLLYILLKALATGTVTKVKVLGILAMIDDGELDWKVIAIDSTDPLASELNDIDDVEAKCPGVVSGK